MNTIANDLFTDYLAAARDPMYFPDGLTPLEYAAALRRLWQGNPLPGDLFIVAHGSDAEDHAVAAAMISETNDKAEAKK